MRFLSLFSRSRGAVSSFLWNTRSVIRNERVLSFRTITRSGFQEPSGFLKKTTYFSSGLSGISGVAFGSGVVATAFFSNKVYAADRYEQALLVQKLFQGLDAVDKVLDEADAIIILEQVKEKNAETLFFRMLTSRVLKSLIALDDFLSKRNARQLWADLTSSFLVYIIEITRNHVRELLKEQTGISYPEGQNDEERKASQAELNAEIKQLDIEIQKLIKETGSYGALFSCMARGDLVVPLSEQGEFRAKLGLAKQKIKDKGIREFLDYYLKMLDELTKLTELQSGQKKTP